MAGMAVLLVMACLVADDASRDKAIAAAQKRYAALVADTTAKELEDRVRRSRKTIVEMNAARIDPRMRGYSVEKINRGDGVFVEVKGSQAFESAAIKSRTIEAETRGLKRAESDLELWKNGALRPAVDVPPLPVSKLAVGQVGRMPPVELIEILDEDTTGLFRVHLLGTPVVIVAREPVQLVPGVAYQLHGGYWVSGKRTIGKQSLFVIEQLPRD